MDTADRTAASDSQLRCIVVTPERTYLDQQVDFVALPLFDGELGLLPGHTPLIGQLSHGELRIRAGEATERYFIDGGFVQVRGSEVTVLTQHARPINELNLTTLMQQLEADLKTVAKTADELEAKHKSVSRTRAMIRAVS
jgi:F-type H+-transporting ATPase subunit epsilon